LGLAITLLASSCSNYDLAAKLESPGGRNVSYVTVVNSNIPANMSTGGIFTAVVTFSASVNIPGGSIFLDNGATITNISTTDNTTWTFDIIGLNNTGVYTINFTDAITDSSGRRLSPFFVTFNHTLN
jgi:hypothetical protein